jgi:hypothetical protein
LAVEEPDCLLGFGAVVKFHEGETALSSSLAIERNKHIHHVARCRKMRANILFRGVIGKVSNKKPDGHVTSWTLSQVCRYQGEPN